MGPRHQQIALLRNPKAESRTENTCITGYTFHWPVSPTVRLSGCRSFSHSDLKKAPGPCLLNSAPLRPEVVHAFHSCTFQVCSVSEQDIWPWALTSRANMYAVGLTPKFLNSLDVRSEEWKPPTCVLMRHQLIHAGPPQGELAPLLRDVKCIHTQGTWRRAPRKCPLSPHLHQPGTNHSL